MRSDIFQQLQADRAAKIPVALATLLDGGEQRLLYLYGKKNTKDLPAAISEAARDAIIGDRAVTIETDRGTVFINVYNPPLRMIIVGAVHIAQALAPMAAVAGYVVHLVDPRTAFASAERFPDVAISSGWPDEAMAALKPDLRTAVVTLTHDPKLDDPALSAALKSDAFYIGALGSGKTQAKRLERMRTLGFQDHDTARIHGPVGLRIGAKSPAEIAISIMGEITQVLRQAVRA